MSAATPEPAAGATPDAAAAPPGKKGLGSTLYKLALSGVGAVMMAQEELASRRRPEPRAEGAEAKGAEAKGAEARPEGAEARPDAPAAAPGRPEAEGGDKGAEAAGRGFAPAVDAAIARVLRTLSIPTRDEVEALGKRIDELARAVDARRR